MNIDRHNYEEFFILYMDNELKPAERQVVESFVQLHPDLKEELDLLMQFKVEPDASVVFESKDELLKKPKVPAVSEINYNDWLLLYVDNELTAPEKLLIDQFLATHPHAAKEWNLLQQARLQPETFVFADKSSLYRTEEKIRRIPVRWWRIAAAAVLLLGIGLTTAIIVNKKSNPKDEIVKTDPGQQKDTQEIIVPKQVPVVADNNFIQEKSEPIAVKTNEANQVANIKPAIVNEKKKPELLIPITNNKEDIVLTNNEEKPTNNLPRPLETRNSESEKTYSDVAITRNSATNDIALKHAVTIASTSTLDFPEGADDPDQADGKKNKLRGFFRKVTRTFEKRTNIATTDDENKLLVAGLAFKLK